MGSPQLAIGIDGCPEGWVVASLQGQNAGVGYWTDLAKLSGITATVMIDMPIGLPELGYRRCDKAARSLLQRNRSRVFLGARRPLLGYSTYSAANAWGKSVGCGVSRQLFGIINKLKEVDNAVAALGCERIKETHPELVFLRLNSFVPLPNKKTSEGREIRRRLVRREGFADIDHLLERRELRAKRDDVLDACVAAIAARDVGHNVLETCDYDAKGIPMQIWY